MKYTLTFKTPGVLDQVVTEPITQSDYDDDDSGTTDLKEFFEKWIRYEEYISIEFDTEANTAVVLPQ
jgi:hypothetical protein